MNCNRTQEYILTDYVDEELDKKKAAEVENHLSSCLKCREFAEGVRRKTLDPFSQVSTVNISQEKIWQKIKQQIAEETGNPVSSLPRQVFAPLERLFSGVRYLNLSSRPMLMLSIFFTAVFIAAVYFKIEHQGKIAQQKASEVQEEFISEVAEEILLTQADENEGYATDIEEYFL